MTTEPFKGRGFGRRNGSDIILILLWILLIGYVLITRYIDGTILLGLGIGMICIIHKLFFKKKNRTKI